MKIIIDTREQLPLKFTCETARECLPVGDYGGKFFDGTSCAVVFERKSINDLYGSLSQGYERFKKEIIKSSENSIRLIIIIEGSLNTVLRGTPNSRRTPISIIHQLFTIRARYGIETVFTNSRDEMSKYITHFFKAHAKEYEDSKNG